MRIRRFEAGVAIREQVQCRSLLLVCAPEQSGHEKEDDDRADAFPFVPRKAEEPTTHRRRPRQSWRLRLPLCREPIEPGLEPFLAEHILRQAKGHPDPGAAKSDVPVHALREIAGDQRTGDGADVDAHVEEREAGIAASVGLLVERPYEVADVRLQQAGADRHECEAGIEEGHGRKHQCEVPERDDDAAYQHAAVLAQKSVGDDAAEDRQAPCAGGVGAVDRCGIGI